jgi:hypothetical protein
MFNRMISSHWSLTEKRQVSSPDLTSPDEFYIFGQGLSSL